MNLLPVPNLVLYLIVLFSISVSQSLSPKAGIAGIAVLGIAAAINLIIFTWIFSDVLKEGSR